jgi:endopeptidase Clp ATP-binding regulatory subunit ClpX
MTDPGKERTKSLEEQVRDMLQRGNLSFGMGRPDQSSAEGAPAAGGEAQDKRDREERLKAIREFNLTPRLVKEYLDRFVIQQDEAKKVLSVAVCDHFSHIRRCIEQPELQERDYAKHNILLLGPTGVGKTYLMRCLAKLVGVPFVKADATKFSETGYVGHDVEDLARDLVKAAGGDVELAQYGIIYLDEIDKIAAESVRGGKDVSGRGVQINLLKLMEETDVSLFSQTDLIGQFQAIMDMQRGKQPTQRTINTRHMLFIVSGAFATLAEQVQKRVASSAIGFVATETGERAEADYLRLVTTGDLIKYGFEPEFVGRLPIRVVCDALSVEDLERIMNESEDSILKQYHYDFESYGIDFAIAPGASTAIAGKAHAEKTGARGLMTVLEKIFRDFKFELPGTPLKRFRVDKETVKSPHDALAKLLSTKDDVRRATIASEFRQLADRFEREQGIRLVVSDAAVKRFVALCEEQDKSAGELWAARFHDMEYGLKLIARNTGLAEFRFGVRMVDDPAGELSRRIAASAKR